MKLSILFILCLLWLPGYAPKEPMPRNDQNDKCDECIFNGELFSVGSIICMPKPTGEPGEVYPYKCEKNMIWVHQDNAPCSGSRDLNSGTAGKPDCPVCFYKSAAYSEGAITCQPKPGAQKQLVFPYRCNEESRWIQTKHHTRPCK